MTMERLNKRLVELESKEGEVQLKLDRLDNEDKGKDLGRERKAVLRELADVKIRKRNLQRIKKKEVKGNSSHTCEETLARVVRQSDDADHDIDAEDENFDPKAVKLNTARPEIRFYPKVPLPHSRCNWEKVVRVGRRRERPVDETFSYLT